MLIQGQGPTSLPFFIVKLPAVAFRPRKRQNLTQLLVGNWSLGASSDVSSVPRQAGKQQRQGLGVISQALSNPRPTTARITACWISPTKKGTTPLGKLHRL